MLHGHPGAERADEFGKGAGWWQGGVVAFCMAAAMLLRHLGLVAAVTVGGISGCKGDSAPARPTTSPPSALSASPDRVPPGVTAVQNEMRLLHEAMRDAVTAIGTDHLALIGDGLRRVARARELTEAAIDAREYILPKNPAKLDAFKEKDAAFHGELEKLMTASESNDPNVTSLQLGVVLSKCSDCHAQFRP